MSAWDTVDLGYIRDSRERQGQPEANGDGMLNHSSCIASLQVLTEPILPLLGTYSSPSEGSMSCEAFRTHIPSEALAAKFI